MTPQPKLGLFAPLYSKPDKVADTTNFLLSGYDLVQDKHEPETLQWFAVKYQQDEPVFAIFDTFAAESGRTAHVQGQVAAALLANAQTLLNTGPEISKVDILASRVNFGPLASAQAEIKKGLSVGLRVLVKAKADKIDTVRSFLTGALSLVEAEPETFVWYAIEFPGTNQFGIVDFFADEAGRNKHLSGEVAKALFGSADELLEAAPDVAQLEVLAVKGS